MSKLRPILVLAALGLVAGGCGKSSSSPTTATTAKSSSPPASSGGSTEGGSSSSSAQVGTRTVGALGTVLVDSTGHTLYVFMPDKHSAVRCTGACASVWPPLKVESGGKASASGGAKQSLLSSDPDPEGGDVVTYAGWPLYKYVADTSPGMATGQGLNINGGLWYVISPSGTVITKKP